MEEGKAIAANYLFLWQTPSLSPTLFPRMPPSSKEQTEKEVVGLQRVERGDKEVFFPSFPLLLSSQGTDAAFKINGV